MAHSDPASADKWGPPVNDPLRDPSSCLWSANKIDAAIEGLEARMEALQARHKDVFELASSWAAHHDAIVAATPDNCVPRSSNACAASAFAGAWRTAGA